jgi:transcriptional regulator GlxA family with amidase domain
MAAETDRTDSPLAEPGKSRLHAERLLISLVVECLSESVPKEIERAQNISQAQVRRAEHWIDSHLSDVIGVDEVAMATGVGIRSLQLSFKRVHGCSPHEFIIKRRLEAARQNLLAATPETTVTSIATNLGFFELGRFAERYRKHFAETPSATLARRRDA